MPKFLRRALHCWLLLPCLAFQPFLAAANSQETFDTGTKPDYPTGTVALASGNWILSDALLGTSDADRKNGPQAVRLQRNGLLTMDFFLPNGAATVTVQHAIYGTDASSSWELWAQSEACNCNKWTKVGSTVLTTTGMLQTAAFTVNIPGKVKFEIRKTSGGLARLDIDDFTVTDFTGVTEPSSDNVNLVLGNPSGAVADPSYPNNYLLAKPQYVVGYNRDQGKPNWVSWHIEATDRGGIDRQDDFRNDTSLPEGWYQVQGTSYQGSGFDRGHNCPSADRTSSLENNSATFLMTNMMPQAPDNNQGPWADLENYARTFLPGNEVYVVCGSYGVGGTGSNGGISTTLDQGRITVPSNTWKVLVILPVGDNDASRVSATTRVIAVDMPNTNGIRNTNWGTFRTSVDAIEAATGYDLLSKLPIEVQTIIESKVDAGPVQ